MDQKAADDGDVAVCCKRFLDHLRKFVFPTTLHRPRITVVNTGAPGALGDRTSGCRLRWRARAVGVVRFESIAGGDCVGGGLHSARRLWGVVKGAMS